MDIQQVLQGYGQEVKQIISDPLDDLEIKQLLKSNVKIIRYNELKKYKSIDELLPKAFDYCFLLYLEEAYKGHWVGLVRRENIIYYFCSYGSKVDEPLSWVNCETREKLGVAKPYLSDLFNASDFTIYYNPVKYQNSRDDYNTCGRYIVLLIQRFRKDEKYNLQKYYQYLTKLKHTFNLSYDQIVSTLVNFE